MTYEFAAEHDPAIDYGLGFSYAFAHGGWPNAHPWEDWAGWEQYVADRVNAIAYWFPEDPVTFWDVWNEPDLTYFWTGTYEQLLELYARTCAVVRSIDADAKIVGPSVSRYAFRSGNPYRDVVQFLIDLEQHWGTRLEAVSWHENDSGVFGDAADKPEDLLDHANEIRMRISTLLPPDYRPELHINEYSGNRVHLSPGYSVGYLYYLIEADIDWANRSCWTVYSGDPPHTDTWSDCWSGLGGMLMNDGVTPQVIYWVYEAAARMTAGTRLPVSIPNARTNVLASRVDADEEIRLLVGRHEQNNTRDVLLRTQGFPWPDAWARVDAARIPHFPELFDDPPKAIPWPQGPVDGWTAFLPVSSGEVTVPLDAFAVNDVWSVTIRRTSATRVLSADPQPVVFALEGGFPNPLTPESEIRFTLPDAGRARLELFDVAGRRVALLADGFRSAGRHRTVWRGLDKNGRPVPAGVYFLRLDAGWRTDTEKVVVAR